MVQIMSSIGELEAVAIPADSDESRYASVA